MARFPEERELILQTDRPPTLETPLHHFQQDVPPNEAFFVRWHVASIPTHVDTGVFRLQVDGHVQRSLSLSLDDLRRRFEPVSVIAIAQCSGNGSVDFVSRSLLYYTGLFPWRTGWARVGERWFILKTLIRQMRSGRTHCRLENRMNVRSEREPSGSHRWCLSRALLLRDELGKIVNWYGTNGY
jgi:hypothetical protein